jgi:hypothetical protein
MNTKEQKTVQLKIFKEEEEKKTYNHAFDLAFQVEGSSYEDGHDCIEKETERVITALRKRVARLERSGAEHLEAFGYIDTFEEE